MLEQYQRAFYKMVVNLDAREIQDYSGGLIQWQSNVYQNNYHQALASSLRKKYRKTFQLYEGDCVQLISQYISQYPSNHTNLALYGRDFPSWLDKRDQMPDYLADIARLDLELFDCYYRANGYPLSVESFLRLDIDQQVSTKLLTLPSVSSFVARRKLKKILDTGQNFGHSSSDGDFYYLVYRDEGVPKWCEITYEMHNLLNLLSTSMSLNELESELNICLEEDFPEVLKKGWVMISHETIS